MNLAEAEQVLKRSIDNAPMSTTERLAVRDALGLFIENINRLGAQVEQLQQQLQEVKYGNVSTRRRGTRHREEEELSGPTDPVGNQVEG